MKTGQGGVPRCWGGVKVTGVKLNYKIGERRFGDIEKVFADPEKSRRLLNWETVRTVEEALLDAWNWEKNISA